jgi:alanine racemase
MNRLGLDLPELSVLAAEPARLDGLELRYVMTHLIASEVADSPTNAAQHARFAEACAALPPAPRCFANSSGLFLGPDFVSDLARPGAALYGLNPTPGRPNPMRLPMRLVARILQLRTIGLGEGVGYNSVWRAGRASRIATLGIGYADGWRRRFAGQKVMAWATAPHARGESLDERPIPLVGRVSMDLTTCDVTDHPALRAGDWLELMGPRQTPDALGAMAGTIGYEILTGLGPRIQRVYTP